MVDPVGGLARAAGPGATAGTLVGLNLSDFDFALPHELIAQEPPHERGLSRLLVVDRTTGALDDRRFLELPSLLGAGDLLVVNNTRVFAARLLGRRLPGGGAAECLLIRRLDVLSPQSEIWEALVHPGQRLKAGSRIELGVTPDIIHGEVLDRRFHGRRSVRLWTETASLQEAIDRIGHIPLPPYIKRPDTPEDRDRYQTVYAAHRGSIAAPTAGLHFTPDLLAALDDAGVERTEITSMSDTARFNRCELIASKSTGWNPNITRCRTTRRRPSRARFGRSGASWLWARPPLERWSRFQ